MIEVSILLLILVGVMATVQSLVTVRFVWGLRRFRREGGASDSLPEAVVVLAVRGRDPFLADMLAALMKQDYPHYAVHIVLDGEIDAARSLVESAISRLRARNVTIDILRNPLDTCTLKCSALKQAVSGLMDRYEVIAFIDADAVPHPQWLRDLVTPLIEDPAVGVTTGNRWYMPCEANWGSLARYYWNAGAVVQMWLNGIPWAGSMALRTETIRRIGLLDAWSRALSVDNTVCREVRRHAYRVCFVPGTIVVNTERISLAAFLVWVQRQIMGARTSPRNWFMIALYAGSLSLLHFVPPALAVIGLACGNLPVVAINGISLLGFSLVSFAAVAGIEWGIRRIVRLNGGQARWLRLGLLWRLFPAMVLTFAVYPLALAKAAFCRRVVWRGVEYEVAGPSQVRMAKYRPSASTEESTSSGSVL